MSENRWLRSAVRGREGLDHDAGAERGRSREAVPPARPPGSDGDLADHGGPRPGRARPWSSSCWSSSSEQLSGSGGVSGGFEATEKLLLPRPRPRSRRGDHAGDPWPGRPHRLGQARPRQRGGARLLPEERIPADGGGGALAHRARPCGARPGQPARGFRHRGGHADAAHGGGPERDRGGRRADPAGGVHEQPRAQPSARQSRADGRDLQLFRPVHGSAVPHRRSRIAARRPRTGSRR